MSCGVLGSEVCVRIFIYYNCYVFYKLQSFQHMSMCYNFSFQFGITSPQASPQSPGGIGGYPIVN